MQATKATRRITAFLDGEDRPDISNPIHSTEVAHEYGFKAALVGGVTVYGWTVPAILEALGEEWLKNGWADVTFRRPVYPGDEMTATVEQTADGWALTMANQDGDACIAGYVGLGTAPFLPGLAMPDRTYAEPRGRNLPPLTLEDAPVGEDLRPMAVPLSLDDAAEYINTKQLDDHPRWFGEQGRMHPGWLAARMTPLIHHSYEYGPAIHTRTQAQHLASAIAGQTITVAGHFLDAYERKGHHYGVVDGAILAEDGTLQARIRHTTIFHVAKREG
ncbi:MAG: hypothetical protein ACRDHF_04755 [Tepidiformaceae bacterium]